jgi:hypothetical protein
VSSPPDVVGVNKKTSTPSTSDRSTTTKTNNLNLTQGTKVDAFRTVTSYFDKGWNAFAQQKESSIQWIPEQIVGIGEDFHSQDDDVKVKTTVYRVRWRLSGMSGLSAFLRKTAFKRILICPKYYDTSLCPP